MAMRVWRYGRTRARNASPNGGSTFMPSVLILVPAFFPDHSHLPRLPDVEGRGDEKEMRKGVCLELEDAQGAACSIRDVHCTML